MIRSSGWIDAVSIACIAVFRFMNDADTHLLQSHAGHLPHAVLIVDDKHLDSALRSAFSLLLTSGQRPLSDGGPCLQRVIQSG